jgi:hypothetical protein
VAQPQPVGKFGETDEHDREQGAAVSLVVEQDVQVVERVLVQEVRLVEDEYGMEALAGEVLDVRGDRVEDGGGSGRGREPKGDSELAVEVAAASVELWR